MPWKKILFIIVIVLAVLVSSLFFLTSIIFNPHTLKARLQRVVKERSPYKLIVHGQVRWSKWPWQGLVADQLEINSKPSSHTHPAVHANIQQVELHIAWLPLLQKKWVIDELHLKQLDATLHASSHAQSSNKLHHSVWLDLLTTMSIRKLHIINSSLRYLDAHDQLIQHIEHFNGHITHLQYSKLLMLQSSFTLKQHSHMPLYIEFNTLIQPKYPFVNFKNFRLRFEVADQHHTPLIAGDLHDDWIQFNRRIGTLKSPSATLHLGTLAWKIHFEGEKIFTDPHLHIAFKIPPTALQPLIQQLPIQKKATLSSTNRIEGNLYLRMDRSHLSLTNLWLEYQQKPHRW